MPIIRRGTVNEPTAPSGTAPSWSNIPTATASFGPLGLAIVLLVCREPGWGIGAGAAASAVVGLSPVLARWHSSFGRWAGTVGVLSWFAVAAVHQVHHPARVLLLGLAAVLALSSLWRRSTLRAPRAAALRLPERFPALAAAITSLTAALSSDEQRPLAAAAAGISLVLALLSHVRASAPPGLRKPNASVVVLCLSLLATLPVGLEALPSGVLLFPFAGALVASLLRSRLETASGRGAFDVVLAHPARLLVATFVALCLAGTLALSLPWSAAPGTHVHVIDAAFTAVSAACVTGLIVLDTPHAFSGVGQAILLLVIQAGGLGIMTISTSALSLLGRRLSLRQEAVMASLVSRENRADLYSALKQTLAVTAAFEVLGAMLLSSAFVWEGDAWPAAAWRGAFTSVSAFCNAGFALQSESLVPYQSNPFVLHVVSLLIVAGGLSPVVLVAMPRVWRRQRLGLQARIALASTGVLLVAGFFAVATLEWSASLAGMGWLDRLHNAWFQSVTLRTAGFNSVDFLSLRPATTTLMLAFMFVGGCPGGTAGGLKTTTVFVLLLSVVASLRGKGQAEVFGRTVPSRTVFKAAAAATMGVLAVLVALAVLLIAQPLPFEAALFEVVSALGTVGLSIGATASLDEVGKIVIMVCMFLGRVGPLTVFLILSDRRESAAWKLPEEDVEVG